MAQKDLVLRWLDNVHGMERALEEVLERHVKDAQGDAMLQSRLQSHLDETRRHAQQVEECIAALGGSVSHVKDAFGNMLGAIRGLLDKPLQDALAKNVIADLAAEHFEIASYRALSEAARHIGEDDVAAVCDAICAEEEAMADWLERRLPMAVRDALKLAGGGVGGDAK